MSQVLESPQVIGIENNFVKTFLYNDKMERNGHLFPKEVLEKRVYDFIGKPVRLAPNKKHPTYEKTLLEAAKLGLDANNPEHRRKAYHMMLKEQEPERVGIIRDVYEKEGNYYAIIQSTNIEFTKAIKQSTVPLYVSPGVMDMSFPIAGHGEPVQDFLPLELSFVDNPAFGIEVATMSGKCEGDFAQCGNILKQSSLPTESHKAGTCPCGMSVQKVISSYQNLYSSQLPKTLKTSMSSNSDFKPNAMVTDKDLLAVTPPANDAATNTAPVGEGVTGAEDVNNADPKISVEEFNELRRELKKFKKEKEEYEAKTAKEIAAARQDMLARYITADNYKDPKVREEKIKFYDSLASKGLTNEDIKYIMQDIYGKAEPLETVPIARARKTSSYIDSMTSSFGTEPAIFPGASVPDKVEVDRSFDLLDE